MTTTPSPNRQARRSRAQSKTQTIIKVTLDSQSWTFQLESAMEELSGRDAAEVRRTIGTSLRALFAAAKDDPDIDTMAALVFLARRQKEPGVTLGEVLDSINYRSEFEVDNDVADGGAAPPEDDDPET